MGGDFETKQLLQKLIFPEGIVINPIERLYRTKKMNPIFEVTHSVSTSKSSKDKKKTGYKPCQSSSVAGTGLEPVTFGL